MGEPRIRVSAILRWRGRILLARHEKAGGAVWLLPGGGVQPGESLLRALQRELWEETGLFPDGLDVPLEGPVAIVDSIAPEGTATRKHVVHVIFARPCRRARAPAPEASRRARGCAGEAGRGGTFPARSRDACPRTPTRRRSRSRGRPARGARRPRRAAFARRDSRIRRAVAEILAPARTRAGRLRSCARHRQPSRGGRARRPA